jgi:hypothetical protein
MNSGSLLRFALIFLSGLMLFMWLGGEESAPGVQPIAEEPRSTPEARAASGSPQELDPSWPGDHEFRQQLFAQFRNVTAPGLPGEGEPDWNLDFDSVDWKLMDASDSRAGGASVL